MAARRVAVAASGGRDSTALLHCVSRQSRELGIEVVALHVHHGLLPEADAWLLQVRKQANRWGASFAACRLDSKPKAGESVEAWARRERYRELSSMARQKGCDVVLLAHHRRDQAETWLLQALRGAGAAGLSAMPMAAEREGLVWQRPWLDQPRSAIEAYARRHRLRFAQDSSNDDARFARSRLRLQVWPALLAAFPDAETSLAAAARRAQEVRALAAEVASTDLALCEATGAGLDIAAWMELTPARRANALRGWLQRTLGQGAPETLVQRLLLELQPAARPRSRATGRWPALGREIQLHRQVLWVAEPVRQAVADDPIDSAAARLTLNLSKTGLCPVTAWRGHFEVKPVTERGACAELLQQVHLAPRAGGERFASRPGAQPRSLKKAFQTAGLNPWQRHGPLVWAADGRLLFVPGLGIHAACWAEPGQAQLALRWVPETG